MLLVVIVVVEVYKVFKMRCSWDKRRAAMKKDIIQDYKEEIFKKEFEKAISNGILMKKIKRFRSAFTTEQVFYLEKEFKKYPYIGNARRKDVSSVLNIPERAVKIWFQNRRMKEKKDLLVKDLDVEDQQNIKGNANGTHLVNSTNLSLNNDQSSLQMVIDRNEDSKVTNADKIESDIKNKVESCDRNLLVTAFKKNSSASVNKNNFATGSNTSAELSIELIKKYKNSNSERTTEVKGTIVKETAKPAQERQRSYIQESYSKPELQKPESPSYSMYSVPQDLSSHKPNEFSQQFRQSGCNKTMSDTTQRRTSEVVNDADMPLYLKGFYSQPYIPPGNMIWKPMAPPAVANGVPAVISNNTLGTYSSQNSVSIRNCTCDCHLSCRPNPIVFQQNPEVHYVLTAVPYQNTLPKYS